MSRQLLWIPALETSKLFMNMCQQCLAARLQPWERWWLAKLPLWCREGEKNPTCPVVSCFALLSLPRNRFYMRKFCSVTFSVVQGLTAVVGPCATSACMRCAASINRIFENLLLTHLNSWPGLKGLHHTWHPRWDSSGPDAAIRRDIRWAQLMLRSGGISVERSLGVCAGHKLVTVNEESRMRFVWGA